MSVAVPFRAIDRNRRVAAGVLAGGIAYRLFLWLLPFGLVGLALLVKYPWIRADFGRFGHQSGSCAQTAHAAAAVESLI